MSYWSAGGGFFLDDDDLTRLAGCRIEHVEFDYSDDDLICIRLRFDEPLVFEPQFGGEPGEVCAVREISLTASYGGTSPAPDAGITLQGLNAPLPKRLRGSDAVPGSSPNA